MRAAGARTSTSAFGPTSARGAPPSPSPSRAGFVSSLDVIRSYGSLFTPRAANAVAANAATALAARGVKRLP